MRVYLDESVREAAEQRIRFCIEEFDEIVVGVSGGKDSTVVFNLTYEIAKEMGELPIHALWIDQEAEYQSTVEIVEGWMERDGVNPIWCQFPFEITNGAGHQETTVMCWDEALDEDEYMHERRDYAITENTYGTYDLKELFSRVLAEELPTEADVVNLGGVRAGESPNRYLGLTGSHTYKGITYGTNTKEHKVRSIYPVYDWTYSDVWKYIHDNDLAYNDIYDYQFRHGVPINDMRVSHLHHQQAVGNLFNLQEFEPETFDKLVERVDGIHSTKTLGEEGILPSSLPFMFEDWREYRNYLLAKLIEDPEDRLALKRHFFRHDLMGEHMDDYVNYVAAHVQAVLINDTQDFDLMNDIKNSISYPEHQAIRDEKLVWLREECPDIWQELADEDIIGEFTKTRLERVRNDDIDSDAADIDVTVYEPGNKPEHLQADEDSESEPDDPTVAELEADS